MPTSNEVYGTTISWSSNNTSSISDSGVYTRGYSDVLVTLTATISYGLSHESFDYTIKAKGYKDLSTNIASGYLYRDYDKLSSTFFDQLDLVYCAFVLVGPDATFTYKYTDPDDSSNNVNYQYINNIYLGRMRDNVISQAHNKGTWVVLSIGGGGQSQYFSDIASDPDLRTKFANNIVSVINDYKFDGVDIDWETPTSIEQHNFTLLMQEINAKVKTNNSNHLVTAAIGGGMWQTPKYDLVNSIQYIDYVNLMTYGMAANSGYYQNALYRSTSYNNTSYNVGKTLLSCSIDEAVEIINIGSLNGDVLIDGVINGVCVPLNKLIVGIAFYGMEQKNEGSGFIDAKKSYYYTDLKNNYINKNGYTSHFDEIAKVPYLLSTDGKIFISYENPTSVIEKCNYAKTRGLAGVMYWENGCDSTGDLLGAISSTMN